jgi:hypothetical protein
MFLTHLVIPLCMDDATKIRIAAWTTGCSRHVRESLNYLRSNQWSDTDAPYLAPRPFVAARVLGKTAAVIPAIAYFAARKLRGLDEDHPGRLDEIIGDIGSDHCAGVCADRAYMVEYPFSWGFDKAVGITVGIAFAPVTFLVGLGYTPMQRQDQKPQDY